jgi:hypothetical protein
MMPDLHDLFSRAIGETPGFDAVAVRRVVARRRRRRRMGAMAFVAIVVATGSTLVVASRHHDRRVLIAPPHGATTSTRTTTTTTGRSGRLGYPIVDSHPDAFRGFGKLAYPSDRALVILDGTGAASGSVSLPGPVERVRWSPDGAWLAIETHSGPNAATGGGELFVMRANATARVRVPVSAAAGDWEWSPTRDVLAVVDEAPGVRTGSITFFAAPNFDAPAAPPIPAEFPGFFAWWPDGSRLLFKTYTAKAPFVDQLWSVDESGCPPACSASPREIPVGIRPEPQSDVGFEFGGWSADGSRLLIRLDVAHSASVAMDGLAVESITLDGTSKAELPRMLVKPSWTAPVAGTAKAVIAVGGDRVWDSHRQLDSCDLDTGACTPLVVNPGPTIDPAVSPDGQRLAYVATDPVVFANNKELPPKSSIRWSRSRRLVVAGLDNQNPQVVATGGVVAPRADDGFSFGRFEEYPYILPGDDVWDTVAWLP